MRLFVAAELPGDVAADLAVWAARATGRDPALRLVAIDALHVTLAFLGARSPDDVRVIEGAVSRAVAGGAWPDRLAVGEPLWLSPRRPHVLTVGVQDPGGTLGALQERVSEELGEAIGFAAEARAFLAHVTVARVRRGRAPRSYDLAPAPPERAFACEAVALMRSHLGGGGAQYEALWRCDARTAARS